MKNFFSFAAALFAALCASCCSTGLEENRQDDAADRITVLFNACPGTRSILGAGDIETRISTIHIAAYDMQTSLLDDFYYGPAGNASLRLRVGRSYAIYALSNLPGRDDVDFPVNESDVEDITWRIPSFEALRDTGLPGVFSERGLSFTKDTGRDIELVRLFSRITLRINHENLTGGNGALFANSHLYVRGANSLLRPFDEDPSRAQSASDILVSSDYDSEMGGSSSGDVFTFYVPENVQGVLLPGNSDQSLKSRENLEKLCPSSASLPTYIEYVGTVSSGESGGGFAGEVTYRFYLGEDATCDFSVVRNKDYRIDLSFIAGNLFNPCWKVTPDLEDAREIFLSRNGVTLDSDRTIVVRPSHPATFTLNVTNGGGGGVADSGLLDEGETIPDLARTYWCSNIAGRTGASLLDELGSDGLEVDFDKETGLFSISVSDPSAFKPGKEYGVRFNLVPSSGQAAGLRLLAMEDVSLDCDSSCEQWYLAQKRTFTVANAYSTYDAKASDSKVSVTRLTGENSFSLLAVDTHKSASQQKVTLSFVPEDTVNDDPISLSPRIKVPLPMYSGASEGEVSLTMDGESVGTGFNYYTEDGSKVLPPESFDADEFKRHFAYTMNYRGFYSWCQVPEYLDPSGYPADCVSLAKCSAGTIDVREYIKGLADYVLGELYFTPSRAELYDEDQYPSLYVGVVNPFPNYDEHESVVGSVNVSGTTLECTTALPFNLKADYRQCGVSWDDASCSGSFRPGLSLGKDCIYVTVDDDDRSVFDLRNDRSRVFIVTVTNKNSLETFQWDYTVNFY